MKSPSHRERLLQKFNRKPRLISSEIKRLTGGQSALDELLAEGVVRKLDAFYLAGHEPSVSTEKARIIKLLEAKPKVFPASFLLPMNRALKSLARSALAELVDERSSWNCSYTGENLSWFTFIDSMCLAESLFSKL
jgi:hypothetical protein